MGKGAKKASSDGKSAASLAVTKRAGKKDVMKASERGGGGDDFDVDALFGAAKKRKQATTSEVKVRKEEERVRVLLPGQKKPKQKRTTAEFTPVDKPRRFEDGLPVYKSYGDFSDMHAGQNGGGYDEKGRKLGPKGEPAGDCPFDCWCCV